MFQAIMMDPSVQSPAMRVYAFLALDNETLRDSNEVIRRRAVRGRIPSINIPLSQDMRTGQQHAQVDVDSLSCASISCGHERPCDCD